MKNVTNGKLFLRTIRNIKVTTAYYPDLKAVLILRPLCYGPFLGC